MHPRVRRGIIDEHLTVFIRNPAVGEEHIAYVTDTFFSLRSHEVTAWGGYQACRIVQGGHIHIEHITQSGSAGTHPMSQVQPAFLRLYRMRALTVLYLLDGVVVALVDDGFLFHLRMCHVVYQGPAYAAAASGINKSILRTGIKGIFAIYKFGMKHHITLLALSLQVGQTLPSLQITGTCNACRSRCRG